MPDTITLGVITVVFLAAGIAAYKFGPGKKFSVPFMFIAGVGTAAGAAGLFGRFAGTVSEWLLGATDTATAFLVGTGVPAAILVILGFYLWARRSGGGKFAMGAAFLYPHLLVAAGLNGIVSLAGDGIGGAGGGAWSLVTGLVG